MKNNMKKILLAVLAVSLPVLSFAAVGSVNTKRDQRGQAAHPLYGGYKHMRNSSTTEMLVCSGKCLLAAIITGTGAPTQGVLVRNTSVANASGIPVVAYSLRHINTTPGGNPIIYPIVLDKGITITLDAGEATVLYEDLDD